MPKGKGKGGRGGGTKAERALRRALARELPAIKAIAECCDGFRDEWRRAKEHPGKEFITSIADRTDEEAVGFWKRVSMGRDGVDMLLALNVNVHTGSDIGRDAVGYSEGASSAPAWPRGGRCRRGRLGRSTHPARWLACR